MEKRENFIRSFFDAIQYAATHGYNFELEQEDNELSANIVVGKDCFNQKFVISVLEIPDQKFNIGAWLCVETDDGIESYGVRGFWDEYKIVKHCTADNVLDILKEALELASKIDWKNTTADSHYVYV